jgi:hypothetical protein
MSAYIPPGSQSPQPSSESPRPEVCQPLGDTAQPAPKLEDDLGHEDHEDEPLTFAITFFPDFVAKTKREQSLGLGALAQLIHKAAAPTKEELPWLKLARFGELRSDKNSLRHDANVLAITGIEADYDGKQMAFEDAVVILRAAAISAIVYTSPSFTEDAPKWRILCFLSREYPPAEHDRLLGRLNGLFGGIFDPASWALSQSYYYGSVNRNPSHRVVVVEGDPLDLRDDLDATAIRPALRETQVQQRASRPASAVGDSLIEQIRVRLDLGAVLASHGYARRGDVYRHPNSQSGSYGLNIRTFSGIERVYSHNGGDPLHPGNLPAWTAGVTAIDVVDVVAILDFGGDRTRAMRDLAARFGLATAPEPRAVPFERLWEAAVPLPGTPAATWLQGLRLAGLITCPELRFHSRCPHPTGSRLPALIAAVRSLDGELTAVHRVYLAADGSELADVDPPRASLGTVMGCAIRLSSIEAVVKAGAVVIGTDLEETTALGVLLGQPTWCAATVQNLAGREGIKLPPEARQVSVIATPGDGAARAAWHRFRREGRTVQTAGAASYCEILNNKPTEGRSAA